MNYPSDLINKHISFYKKALQRISDSGGFIVDGATTLESSVHVSDAQETIEKASFRTSVGATAEKFSAVKKELEEICKDYTKLDRRAQGSAKYYRFDADQNTHLFSIILHLGVYGFKPWEDD